MNVSSHSKTARAGLILLLGLALLIPQAIPSGVSAQTTDLCVIDFEYYFDGNGQLQSLSAGEELGEQWAEFGVHITTLDAGHPAVVFDSANPTCNDPDLGTPNQDFGGPGIGDGGRAGTAGENAQALGNIMIIDERRDTCTPDDDSNGGTIRFTFDSPQHLEALEVLDIDDASAATIMAYGAGGTMLAAASAVHLGDNSYQMVRLDDPLNPDGGVDGVSQLDINFSGSGAVPAVYFCPPPPPASVDLVSFDATFQGTDILLTWETASEVNSVGFNLYRAESHDGRRTRLNVGQIPSQAFGSPVGASYQFLDESVVAGVTYYYWLEDVDSENLKTLRGPVVVKPLLLKAMPGRPRPRPITVDPILVPLVPGQ